MTDEQLDDLRDCARATRKHLRALRRFRWRDEINPDVLIGMEITASKIENIVFDLEHPKREQLKRKKQ